MSIATRRLYRRATKLRPRLFIQGKTVKIMPLGDSQVDGDGSTSGTGFRQVLWGKLNQAGYMTRSVGDRDDAASGYDIVDSQHRFHAGHSGWTLLDLDGSIGGWMGSYMPDVILVMGGGNDLDTETAATATSRMNNLVRDIFSGNPAAFVFVSTTTPANPPDAKRQAYNASIQPLVNNFKASGYKAFFVDNGASMTPGDYSDEVHANDSGYVKMATNWYSAMVAADKAM